MKLENFKIFIIFHVIFLLCCGQKAYADILFAPYVAQSYGTIDQTGTSNVPSYANTVGPGYGLKLGYAHQAIYLGFDGYHSKEGLSLKNTNFNSDYDMNRKDYGLMAGLKIAGTYNLSFTYFISSKLKEVGSGDSFGTWSGSAFKTEIGFDLYKYLSIGLAYQVGTYKKWESQTNSSYQNSLKSDTQWKTHSYLLSISVPITFVIDLMIGGSGGSPQGPRDVP